MKPWHRLVLSGSVASDQGQTALAVLPRTAATDPLSTTSSTREPQAVRDAPVAQPDSTFPVSQAEGPLEPASLVDSTFNGLLGRADGADRTGAHPPAGSNSRTSLPSSALPSDPAASAAPGVIPTASGATKRKRVVL